MRLLRRCAPRRARLRLSFITLRSSQTQASIGLYYAALLADPGVEGRPGVVLRRGFIDCGVEGAVQGDEWIGSAFNRRKYNEVHSEQGFARR
jgi:hypothetical protein